MMGRRWSPFKESGMDAKAKGQVPAHEQSQAWGAVDGGWPVSPVPGICVVADASGQDPDSDVGPAVVVGLGMLLVILLFVLI
jgi:hypothetical protein